MGESGSCSQGWSRPEYDRGDGSKGDLLQNASMPGVSQTVVFGAPNPVQAAVDSHLCLRLLDPHRQVWVSLLWAHFSFLLGPGAQKVLFVSPGVSFYSLVEVLKSNPTGPQSQIPRGFSVPLPDPQVEESVVGPSTFATM